MPFKSEAQRRFMYAAESRGDVPKGTAERWQKETKDKSLPEYINKKVLDRIREKKKQKAY